jgi:hypothetical protein
MSYVKIFYAYVLFCFGAFSYVFSQDKCNSELLLDGSEQLVFADIDTTGNWWAITQPFSHRYSVIIQGIKHSDYDSVKQVIFSPDGLHFAYFAYKTGQWNIIVDDTILSLQANLPGIISFNRRGYMFYSIFQGENEILFIEQENGDFFHVAMYNRMGQIFVSNDCKHYAYQAKRGVSQSIVIDNIESDRYINIVPCGFMLDNSFVYAAEIGEQWRLMRSEQELFIASSIYELHINQAQTIIGCIKRVGNTYNAIMISDEFREPYYSPPYDMISNITLHPEAALIGFKSIKNNNPRIVLNSSEYESGNQSGNPAFTHDGSAFFFAGDNNQDQFMSVNGQKYIQKNGLNTNKIYALAPGSSTFAFTTSSALIMQNIHNSFSYAGIMVDTTSKPIYNYKTKRYEAIGVIRNRLYLMYCYP